jgi:hypothetical protein
MMATRSGRETAVTVVAIAAAAATVVVLIGLVLEARRSTIARTSRWPSERALALSPRSVAFRARLDKPEEEDYEDRDYVSLSASDPEGLDSGSDSDSSSSPLAEAAPGSPSALSRRARVLRNAGGGDCLFHCIVQAVSLLGREDKSSRPVTVAELRRAVADSMTEPVLADLRCLYNDAVKARDASVVRDYAFMDGVETLEQLRAAMQTSRYWGDEMALPVLERVTGLRVVVLVSTGARYSVAARLDRGEAPGKRVIFVRLRNQHYELLEFGGQVVFDSASLRPRAAVGASSEA